MPPRKRPPVPKETSAEQEKMAPSVPQTKTAEVSMPASPLPVKEPKDTANVEKGEGFYRVHKGDSLFKIAGLKDIYGDPIKWPSLFRLNMDRLDNIQADDDLEHKELPEGLSLRFVTPHEASENRYAGGNTYEKRLPRLYGSRQGRRKGMDETPHRLLCQPSGRGQSRQRDHAYDQRAYGLGYKDRSSRAGEVRRVLRYGIPGAHLGLRIVSRRKQMTYTEAGR
jgi:hypothetical protein